MNYVRDVPILPLEDYEKVVRECDSIEEMARVNIKRLREIQQEGPYRLSGFCGMALVAFEMARILYRQGEEISLLALLDPSPVSPTHTSRASSLRYYSGRLLYHAKRFYRLHPKSWSKYYRTRLSTIGRRLTAKSLEIADRPIKDLQSRIEKAVLAYSPQVYPGRATVFISSEWVAESHGDTDFGWSSLVSGGLDVRIIPGRHETVFDEPNILTLAKEFQAVYAESLSEKSTSKSMSSLQE